MGIKGRMLAGVLLSGTLAFALACEDDMSRSYQSNANSNRGMADTSKSNQLSDVDNMFVKDASQAGKMEVQLAQLAADQATNSDVKAFANRLVQDHSQANNELMQLSSRVGATIPPPDAATTKAATDKLSNLKGHEFDRAFIDQMVNDHQQAVSMFERYSSSGQNADLKAFASKTLPTLKDHLQTAESLNNKLTGSALPKK